MQSKHLLKTKLGFAPSLLGLVRRMRKQEKCSQWTNRLASLVDKETPESENKHAENGPHAKSIHSQTPLRSVPVSLRLEGPYFTAADPARYNNVVCIVAGTGVSGALAIVAAFQELERSSFTMVEQNETCSMGRNERRSGEETLNAKCSRAGSNISVPREKVWRRCIVIWSVREDDYIGLPGLRGLSKCV